MRLLCLGLIQKKGNEMKHGTREEMAVRRMYLAIFTMCLCGVMYLFSGCAPVVAETPPSEYKMNKEEVYFHALQTVYRFENKEAVCYKSGHGLSCNFKPKPIRRGPWVKDDQ